MFLLLAAAYAQLSSLSTQLPSKMGTVVTMDVVDAINNIDLSPNKDKIIIKESGVYFIMSVGQVGATSLGESGYVDTWINKNGVFLANSGSRMSVDTSASTGTLVSQTIIPLKVGDVISNHFGASAPSLGFIFLQPLNEPANTSISFSIFKID